ncbi:hypothetical protein BU16DRAFT_179354 [Lophium mytilinum]|uniref:Fungal N-terminal domain-containing protein n=1 Tax=Lophium mytilinum TaxID=390894 RepID=A0A6A6QD06_9PEZI|nr:hypothetical protein BU16DRAFT_179354 [Lophium mytilinum]
MAEIGLIASVIQVAGAGLTLADTLYQYADSVSSADKRIKDIAKDVKLTSRVIDELGSIFKKNETALLLSKNAVSTAEETVLECSSLFEEMDAAIKKTKKSTLGKLMFPFQAPKMELLRANIDRLKSTLQLLMQVLTHAYQVASHNVDKEAAAAQRHQIKILIKAKKESTKRYEESLKNYSPSDDSIVLNDNASTTRDRGFDPDAEQSDGMVKAATIFGSTINKSSLKSCVAHIQKLLEDIELVQRCLSSDDVGAGHSEHQQRLIGSYFNAREHLDTVILGGSSSKRTDTGLSGSTAGKGQRIATADLGAAGIASIKDAPKNERHIVGAVIGGLGAAAVASDNTFEFPTYASMDPQLAQSLRMKYEEEKAREEHEKKAKEAAKNKTELENMPDEDLEAELEKAFKEYAALKSDVSDFQAEIGHIGDGKNHGTNQVWRKPTQRDELDELLRKIQDMKKELHDYVWSPEFGLGSSPPSSYPDKSIGDSPALQNLHNSAFGDDARNGRGDFLGSSPPDSTDQQADSSEKDAQAEEERKVSKNLEEEEDFEKRVEEELRKRLVILGFQDSPIGSADIYQGA